MKGRSAPPGVLARDAAVLRAVGARLRQARLSRQWTGQALADELAEPLSTSTLFSYEQGIRSMPVSRLFELCRVLQVPVTTVVADVVEALADPVEESVRVNLATLAASTRPELEPARRWAASVLRRGRQRVVTLDPAAVDALAALCQLAPRALVAALRKPTPDRDAVRQLPGGRERDPVRPRPPGVQPGAERRPA